MPHGTSSLQACTLPSVSSHSGCSAISLAGSSRFGRHHGLTLCTRRRAAVAVVHVFPCLHDRGLRRQLRGWLRSIIRGVCGRDGRGLRWGLCRRSERVVDVLRRQRPLLGKHHVRGVGGDPAVVLSDGRQLHCSKSDPKDTMLHSTDLTNNRSSGLLVKLQRECTSVVSVTRSLGEYLRVPGPWLRKDNASPRSDNQFV